MGWQITLLLADEGCSWMAWWRLEPKGKTDLVRANLISITKGAHQPHQEFNKRSDPQQTKLITLTSRG